MELNFAYLCAEHHTGKNGVHHNRAFDLELKVREQRSLEMLFREESYHIAEIAELVKKDRRRLEKRMQKVKHKCGEYRREEIIKYFMGGKLYDELNPPPEKDYQARGSPEGFIFLEDK